MLQKGFFMANLSRSEKYRELRNSLQNEIDDGYQSKELSRFEKRLNRIDSRNFSREGNYTRSADDYDPSHARRLRHTDDPEFAPAEPAQQTTGTPSFAHSRQMISDTGDSYENDFLDQYIREVKQYNVSQGNAVSDNTSVNVLQQLNPQQESASVRDPYASVQQRQRPVQMQRQRTEKPQIQHDYYRDFYKRRYEDQNPAQEVPAQAESPFEEDSQTMSKEDIMAEVQNLVNGRKSSQSTLNVPKMPHMQNRRRQQAQTQPAYNDTFDYSEFEDTEDDDYFDRHSEEERDTRQQLLNETTQMRAQLDDYEDNLNEVSDKIRHTDRILNIVLIVLIIALGIALAFVVYWIVLTR